MELAMTDGAKRVREHREKMKAARLKPGPDVSAPGYREEIRRQCELINADPDSQRVMEEMLAVADFSDWK
jgi:Protein  of unknown function (DUF3018)